MVYKRAEVQVLGDDKALLLHGPTQDGCIRHMRVDITNEQHVKTGLPQGKRNSAPDVVVEQQPQRHAVHAPIATG